MWATNHLLLRRGARTPFLGSGTSTPCLGDVGTRNRDTTFVTKAGHADISVPLQ
jgi:hypothetical protein